MLSSSCRASQITTFFHMHMLWSHIKSTLIYYRNYSCFRTLHCYLDLVCAIFALIMIQFLRLVLLWVKYSFYLLNYTWVSSFTIYFVNWLGVVLGSLYMVNLFTFWLLLSYPVAKYHIGILILITDSVLTHQPGTESSVVEAMAKCLKYAPDRTGGGGCGRRNSSEGNIKKICCTLEQWFSTWGSRPPGGSRDAFGGSRDDV